jgi:putative resolvase
MMSHRSSPQPNTTLDDSHSERSDVIYARVSTRKQLPDLDRQIEGLQRKHPNCTVYRDCASGLNFRRKGLKALLECAAQGNVRNVHIANRDRLCRFAYDLIRDVLQKHGANIVVDADSSQSTSERELADDIISILTVFSARMYGRRSSGRRGSKAIKDSKSSAPISAAAAGHRCTT